VIPSDLRLYTWLDAEEVLFRWLENNEPPEWFVDARAYWDGITVRIRGGHTSAAEKWLRSRFEPRIVSGLSGEQLLVALESLQAAPRILPISIEETDESTPKLRINPSFARPVLVQPGGSAPFSPPILPDGGPAIFAFHSFKGGVGRTLHAVALAQAFAESRRSVLLIDADLEAPGITWMIRKRLPDPPISFADLLALVHGDADPMAKSSIDLAGERLRDALLDGIYVLPAFRSPRTFQALEVRPEHLLQGRENQFFLTDLLAYLGIALGVEAVIIDLRAGLSELAAGLLLDPRIARVFVTSLSGQSLDGTELVLNILADRAPSAQEADPIPIVVVNQVLRDLGGSDVLSGAEERMLVAISGAVKGNELDTADSVDPVDVLPGPSWFDQGLLTLPSSWDEVLAAVRRSGPIRETVKPLANLAPSPQSAQDLLPADRLDREREALSKTAYSLIFAEKGEGEDFLAIPPLRRLVESHRSQLPASVVVGSKGAGKTFTFLQIVQRRSWSKFAADLGGAQETIDAVICPVLQPLNASARAPEILASAREGASRAIGGHDQLKSLDVQDQIRNWLRSPGTHEGEWRERWLDLMAWAVGFQVGEKGAGRGLSGHLASRNQRLLLVFDGLEDMFQQLSSDQSQQLALRSLLQDVPNWLDQQPERSIGVLIFVRRDMVLNAVSQNWAQLLSRYEQFALKWEKIDALRLVSWIVNKAHILEDPAADKIREMDEESLTEVLAGLWGRKLGKDKSREGRSADWVVAALSDFHGQVQARDLVRLLYIAAFRSRSNIQWLDRVLVPPAIRGAVSECSKAKIEEISEENPALKLIFDHLKGLPEEQRNVPFMPEQVSLNAKQIELLVLSGIVVSHEGSYYMAEIFRHALNFRLPSGKRPKILALARKRPGGF
jgi:MinD-like ATPase involved in chromosome partitioning or flagellar assembly